VDGVTISLSDALKNSSAFSLNSKGTLKTLSVQSRQSTSPEDAEQRAG